VTARAEPAALREMTLADIPGGLERTAEAGWNQREPDWRFLLESNPGRFVVAERAGRIVGSGGAMCYGRTLAWICMILVDGAERGQGLGTRIVEEVRARLRDMASVGLDATPLGQGIYARLGFVETGRLLRLERPAGPRARREAPPSSGRVRALAAHELEDVLALDRAAFGADRAAVLRWAASAAPAFCLHEEGRVTGYCFARPGARFHQIGPIVARDLAAARALLEAAMRAAEGAPLVVDARAEREDWRAVLAEAGFVEQRPLARMYLEGRRPPAHGELELAIFGPDFG